MAIDTSDFTDRLTHKIGPLPTWAWVAIPAAGYVVWSYFRAQSASTTTTDTTTTDTTDGQDYGLNTGGAYLPGYGTSPYGSSNPYYDPYATPTIDNSTWARQAVSYLISLGYTATDAVNAINGYLNGTPPTLTTAQQQALQKAIAYLGPAPSGGFIPPTTQTPTTPTPTPTTAVPSAPTSVQRGTISRNSASVTWNAPQQTNGTLLGYSIELWVYSVATKKWTKQRVATTLPSVHSYTFAGLAANTTYSIHVLARNSKGYGPYADTYAFTTPK